MQCKNTLNIVATCSDRLSIFIIILFYLQLTVFPVLLATDLPIWGWAQTDQIGSMHEALPFPPNPQTMRDRQWGGH